MIFVGSRATKAFAGSRPAKRWTLVSLPHYTCTVALMHRGACLAWVPENVCVSVELWQRVHPALDLLTGVVLSHRLR